MQDVGGGGVRKIGGSSDTTHNKGVEGSEPQMDGADKMGVRSNGSCHPR